MEYKKVKVKTEIGILLNLFPILPYQNPLAVL